MSEATPSASQKMAGALAAGDERAWADFLREHDALIRAVVAWRKWRFDEVTRQDVAQKVRMDLQRAFATYRGDSSIVQLVKQVSIRRCIDEVRRQVRERRVFAPIRPRHDDAPPPPEAIAGEDFDPVRAVVCSERAARLRKILAGIDETCRTVIQQFYMEQKSYREMAAANGIAVNTVGSRLSKCLDKLRVLIRHDPNLGEDFS